MPITHIVSFAYKENTPWETKTKLKEDFFELKESCLLPHGNEFGSDAGKKYIVDIIAGAQNSEEGLDKDFEHIFLVTFANKEHRDYYVLKDPAHDAFKIQLGGLKVLKDLLVLDFEDGAWSAKK